MAGPPSHSNQPLISVESVDFDIIEKVAGLFSTKPYKVKNRNVNWKQTWIARIRGKKSVEIMQDLLPLMSKRRQSQVKRAMNSYEDKSSRIIPRGDYKNVVERFNSGISAMTLAKEYGCTKWTIYRLRERYLGP